jgi:tol-pal system protein YbgF
MQGILLRYKWMASLALAIAFTVPAQAQTQTQTSSGREQMVDMVLQLQQLQDEVRVLRGQIEEQAHLIETLQRRQRDQYLDLDQRIGELSEMRPPASASPPVGAGPAAPPPEDLPEVREERREPSTVSGLPTPDTSARAVSEGPAAEKDAYDKAFQALKELRYAEAAEQFRSFLQKYPQSEYAGNAQYWLGESYYVTRNYEFALEAFQGMLDSYPDSTKVPDSLLKVGYTHYELKQWDLARAALTQVQEQYPNTTVARLAENRLRSMRLEGHY